MAFLTAYADRDDAAFKASVSELVWRSFVWFMSEPDEIVVGNPTAPDRMTVPKACSIPSTARRIWPSTRMQVLNWRSRWQIRTLAASTG